MRKRIIAILMAVFMVAGVLPVSALAEEGESDDVPVIVCTEDENCTLTEGHNEGCPKGENGLDAQADKAVTNLDLTIMDTKDNLSTQGWAWNKETLTLTLDGLNLVTDVTPAISAPAGTTIILADGSVNIINTSADSGIGIECTGNLTVKTVDEATTKGTLNITASNKGIIYSIGGTVSKVEDVVFDFSDMVLNITAQRGVELYVDTSAVSGKQNSISMSNVTSQIDASGRMFSIYNAIGSANLILENSALSGVGDIYVQGKGEHTTVHINKSSLTTTGMVLVRYGISTVMTIEESNVVVNRLKLGHWGFTVDLTRLVVNDSTLVIGPAATSDGAIEVGTNYSKTSEAILKNSKVIAVNINRSAISVSQVPKSGEDNETARGKMTMENCEFIAMGTIDFTHAEADNHKNGNHITCVVYPSIEMNSNNGIVNMTLPVGTLITSGGVTYTVTQASPSNSTLDTTAEIMSLPTGTMLGIHKDDTEEITISSDGTMTFESGHVVSMPANKTTTVTLKDGTIVKITPVAEAPLYIDTDGTIEIPAGASVQVGEEEAVTVQKDSALKDGQLKTEIPSATQPNNQDTIQATYGDKINMSVKVDKVQTKMKSSAPAHDFVGFYYGETLLGRAPVTYTDDTKTSCTATFEYDTAKGSVPVGENNKITVKYGGNFSLQSSTGTMYVNLTKKELDVTGLVAIDREYDGTTAVQINTQNVSIGNGVVGDDEIFIDTVDASMNDVNVGANKPVTINKIVLSGEDSQWYSMKYPTNLTVTITAKKIAADVTEIVNGVSIIGPAIVDQDNAYINENGKVKVGDEEFIVSSGSVTVKSDGSVVIPGDTIITKAEGTVITGPAVVGTDGSVEVETGGKITINGTEYIVTTGPVAVEDGEIIIPTGSVITDGKNTIAGPALVDGTGEGQELPEGSSVTLGSTTIKVTDGKVIEKEDGSIEIPSGSAAEVNGQMIAGPASISADGDKITISEGGSITVGDSKVVIVKGTATLKEDGTLYIPADCTVIMDGVIVTGPAWIDNKGIHVDLPIYKITSGDKAIVTKGNSVTIVSDAEFSKFVRVKVDGKVLNPSNYIAERGSTKITLKAEYINTLSEGEHTLIIVSTDGSAIATFTVEAGTGNMNAGMAATGDQAMPILWIMLLIVNLCAVIYMVQRKKITKNHSR